MKKTISIILAIVFALSLFAGCNKTEDQSDNNTQNDKYINGFETDEELDEFFKNNPQGTIVKNIISEEDAFKEPISFECNGKTITVTPHYTDITFTELYYEKMYKFCDGVSRINYSLDLQYITKDGELITTSEYEKNYKTDNEFYPEYLFEEAKLPDGTPGSFAGNGGICVMTGEPGAYTQWLYSEDGKLLTPNGFDRIGDFNSDGVAAVSQDHKIGFIDEQGNILLEPTIAYDEIRYVSGLTKTRESFYIEYIYENAFILPINNKLAIITIE